MAKVTIELPDSFQFSTEIDILIQHINGARHLGNDHLVALLNEARMRFMASLPTEEMNINARSFINADLAVIYKSECHYGDKLTIEVAANEFSKYGCDFVYRVTQTQSKKLVALAKTAMLMFDYEKNQLKPVPNDFKSLFEATL